MQRGGEERVQKISHDAKFVKFGDFAKFGSLNVWEEGAPMTYSSTMVPTLDPGSMRSRNKSIQE